MGIGLKPIEILAVEATPRTAGAYYDETVVKSQVLQIDNILTVKQLMSNGLQILSKSRN
jgi:hypothetical protein